MNALSWRAERAFLKAWPALSTVTRNDWQARFANGLSRRANSVNPLIADSALTDTDIRFFEHAYRAQNLPPIVRVPTLLHTDVDRILESHGFTSEGECCVLHGALGAVTAQPDPAIEITQTPTRAWFDAMHAAQGRAGDQRPTYEAIINAISLSAGFLTLRDKGGLVALAYGAIDGDLLCVESVVTAVSHRGKGYAKRLMAALLHWAKGCGATTACLQMEANNAAALAVYRRIGLSAELYRYHYRRANA
jgi:GNAT superfamily N-acetyltransferase